MIFTYQNRESSLYNKTSTKISNNAIVATIQPSPRDISSNRTIYSTIELVDVIDPCSGNRKFSRNKISSQKNPIKHYRREYSANVKKNITDINLINMPGKTIITNDKICPTCNNQDTLIINNKIFPNNEKCRESLSYQSSDPNLWKTISCNSEDKIIRPAQTIISQNYSHSMASLRYRRGQTYSRNLCNNPQTSIKNNGNECSTNTDSRFTTNKHTIQNGSTSISDYRRQYGQNYSDNTTNVVNNSLCCNKITIKDPNNTVCYPHIYPNLSQSKNICCRY